MDARIAWWRAAVLLAPVLLLLAVLTRGILRHEQVQAVGAALARGGTPRVPEIVLPDFDGRPVALAELRGHPVVLNFWASWCIPCAEESAILEQTWKAFGPSGVLVVGVDTQDLEEPARRFLSRHAISYRNLRDADGTAAHVFGTTGVPETFFISADGHIVGKFPGEQLDRSTWRAAVSELLDGHKPVP